MKRCCTTLLLMMLALFADASAVPCSGVPDALTAVTTVQRRQDSVQIGFTIGLQTDSVLIIRRRNNAPSFTPATATRYAVGQAVNATDTVAYFGPAVSPATVRSLQADSLYVFALYGFQSCNVTYSATAAYDTARTYCNGTTIGNPTDLARVFTTANTAGLSIVGANDATAFIIFSNGPDTLRPAPVNGVPYVNGNIVGDDTVRYVGAGRRPIIGGLAPSTSYLFTVRAIRACNYTYSTGWDTVTASTIAPCAGGSAGQADSLRVLYNVPDTLRMRWRAAANANGYVIVARIDSTPTVGPVNGTFYLPGDTLGSKCFILGTSIDTTVTFIRLPANVAYFTRVYAYKACDLSYSATAPFVAPVATRGTATSQRFAIRYGARDTIRFAGSITAFTSPVTSDGSLLITRNTGSVSLIGIPMVRTGRDPINLVSTDRWWSYRKVGLGTTNFDLYFDITGIKGIQDTSDLEIIFRTAPTFPWEDFITSGYMFDTTGHYLAALGRTFISSEYAIGASGKHNTLPVHLLSFEGYSQSGHNILRWRTASETDNAGFRLSRAVSGSAPLFTMIADHASDPRLAGAGTTNAARDYGYIDAPGGLLPGQSYIYRLEEVSLDGSSNEIGRLTLGFDAASAHDAERLTVTPNPAAGAFTVGYRVSQDGPLEVTLVDALGRPVRTLAADASAQPGFHLLQADAADLPAGMYFCRVVAGGITTVRPVVVAR